MYALPCPYFFAFAGAGFFAAAGLAFLAPRSFSALPGLNLPEVLAAILISLPVAGFLPIRALRVTAEKVPKPIRVTLSPALIAVSTVPVKAANAFSATALVIHLPALQSLLPGLICSW